MAKVQPFTPMGGSSEGIGRGGGGGEGVEERGSSSAFRSVVT